MNKKFFATLLTLALFFGILPSTAVSAAATDPYCRIMYDSAYACMTVKYYSYTGNSAQIDYTRLVKFYDGKIYLSTGNTLVTDDLDTNCNPSWSADGQYLIWIETGNEIWARKYGASSNVKLGESAKSLNMNAEHMVSSVTFSDNSSKTISELVKNDNSNPATETASTATAETPATETSSTTVTATKVEEWIDSAGQEHFKFGKNKVLVDGNKIYFNNNLISELCDSGVRYVGVDNKERVYLYEDSTVSFYQFTADNMFKPNKIKFATNCQLLSVNTDENGFMISVETTNGTFTISQLVVDKEWYPKKTYAVNKNGYATYYLADTHQSYTLKLEGKKLYLDGKLVANGISRPTESFGFYRNSIRYLKGSKEYEAPLNNPTAAYVIKQNIAKLAYSTKDGQADRVKRLSTKVDYVKNSKNKAVLYQSGKAKYTLVIAKKGTQVTLNGKVIARLSKKQQKAKAKFTAVGFTEDGKIFYTVGGVNYRADLKKPKKASKWNAKTKRNGLGFTEKVSKK